MATKRKRAPAKRPEPRSGSGGRAGRRRDAGPAKLALSPEALNRLRTVGVVVGPLVLGAVLFFGFVLGVYPRRPQGEPGRDRRYLVPRDATPTRVASDLGTLGLVESPWLFSLYLSLRGAGGDFRVGEPVTLRSGMTPRDLGAALARGMGARVLRVTVPEGLDVFQVAERLHRAGLGTEADLLAAMRDPATLREYGIVGASAEGYLHPDTYDFRDGDSPAFVVRRLLETRRARLETLFERNETAVHALHEEFGWGTAEILTLASVVEEEAAVADERARIAGVFLNRLRSSTFLPQRRLQSDPTVSYGCKVEPAAAPSCASFDGTITRAMLDDTANRYNSYRHPGLPPSPIDNPGLPAIEAVLRPEAHRFFYFVARGGRRHTFSETLEGHEEAVDDSRDRGVLP